MNYGARKNGATLRSGKLNIQGGKMIDPPKTLKEAEKIEYGSWAGNPKGRKYHRDFCAYEVYPAERLVISYQCSRKNGHGPERLYCKQHAKMID